MKKKTLLKGLLTIALGFTLAACGNSSFDLDATVKYGKAAATNFYADRKLDAKEYADTEFVGTFESHSNQKIHLNYKANQTSETLVEGDFNNSVDVTGSVNFKVDNQGEGKYVNLSIVRESTTRTITNSVDANQVYKNELNVVVQSETYHFFTSGDKFYLRKLTSHKENGDEATVSDKYCEYDEAGYATVINNLLKQANKEVDDEFFDLFDIEILIYGDDIVNVKKSGKNLSLGMKYTSLNVNSNSFEVSDSSVDGKIKFENKKPVNVKSTETESGEKSSYSSTKEFKIIYSAEINVVGINDATLDNSIKVSNISNVFDID